MKKEYVKPVLCACGCGQPVPISSKPGRINRFVAGHTSRIKRDIMAHLQARSDMSGECWVWQGARNYSGYGAVGHRHKIWLVHRLAWTLVNGPIPGKMSVLHRCDNPPCWRPDHLFLGTDLDNVRDALAKNRFYTGNGDSIRGDKNWQRQHPDLVYRGERNGMARLTDEAVIRIRSLHTEGWTMAALAREYGITRQNIRHIVTGRTWRHLSQSP